MFLGFDLRPGRAGRKVFMVVGIKNKQKNKKTLLLTVHPQQVGVFLCNIVQEAAWSVATWNLEKIKQIVHFYLLKFQRIKKTV